MSRRTAPMMLRAVREIEQCGQTDLWDYLIAHSAASHYLGAKLPGPLGLQSRYAENVKLLAMCFAAHAMIDEERALSRGHC